MGFLASAYLGFYFFFQLDVVANFNHSELKILPLILPSIAVLPVLAWYFEAGESRNGFANVLLLLVLAACVGQQFVPAYMPDTPRDMDMMYRQEVGQPTAWLILESVSGSPDPVFAREHGFSPVNLPPFDGRGRQVLAQTVAALDIPEIVETAHTVHDTDETGSRQHHTLELQIPAGVRLLAFEFPRHANPSRAMVNGQLAFAAGRTSARFSHAPAVIINHPDPGPMRFEFDVAGGAVIDVLQTARFDLPPKVLQPYMSDWPENAQPAFLGPRVLQISHISLAAQASTR